MVKRRDSNGNSNAKVIWILVIVLIIAVATILILKLRNPELSPIGTAKDDLIGKSLILKYGINDKLRAFLPNEDNSNIETVDSHLSIKGDNGISIINDPKFTAGDSPEQLYISSTEGITIREFSGFGVFINTHTGRIDLKKDSLTLGFNNGIKQTEIKIDRASDKIKLDGNSELRSLSYSATPNDKFREVWGSVSATGTKTGGSAGWTVAKTTTGTYKITLLPAFASGTPFVSITPTQDVARFVSISSITTSSFIVKMRGTGGGLQDTSFNFLVRGAA